VRKIFFPIAIILIALTSCPNEYEEDLVNKLRGNPKRETQWGSFTTNIPNCISNTFTDDPKTTRTITWQSTIKSGEVIIGNDRYPSEGIEYIFGIDSIYLHKVDLTGLEPGKTYWFIVGSSGYYSPAYSFRTERSSGEFTILHITDPQIGNTDDAVNWKRVIEAAHNKYPNAAFIVNTGDIVNNLIERRLRHYFDYAQAVLANYAFVYAMGNNDSLDWYGTHFYITDNKNVDKTGILYSFDYGNTHFISINVAFTDDEDKYEEVEEFYLSDNQVEWLENDLKNTSMKWKVAMIHKPDFAKKSRANAESPVTELFDTYNVDLVLGGHYHFYARSRPMDKTGASKINGTVWSIPNAAGTKFNEISTRGYLTRNDQPDLPMFSAIRFTASGIHFSAYTVDVKDNFRVELYDAFFR